MRWNGTKKWCHSHCVLEHNPKVQYDLLVDNDAEVNTNAIAQGER